MAQDQNQSQMKIQTGKAVVARGRSIDVPVPGKTVVVGTDDNGRALSRAVTRHYVTGQEVELPLEEIKALRKSGYLVDPENAAPPSAEGPRFGSEEPGSVRAA